MLEIVADFTAVTRALADLPAALDRQQPQLLGQIGTRMEERARADFLVKARGGTGAGGIKWAAVTPAERQRKQRAGTPLLGIRTGQLLGELTYRTSGTTAWGRPIADGEVVIEFRDQPKANAFNAERPLFPTLLPADWYSQVDGIVQQSVDRVVQDRFSESA